MIIAIVLQQEELRFYLYFYSILYLVQVNIYLIKISSENAERISKKMTFYGGNAKERFSSKWNFILEGEGSFSLLFYEGIQGEFCLYIRSYPPLHEEIILDTFFLKKVL